MPHAYKTLVRPILEYCSSVWDPHTSTLIKQLESIQNRAARFVKGSVKAIKQELNWESLQHRRKVDKLTNFQQAVAGKNSLSSVKRPASGRKKYQTIFYSSQLHYHTMRTCNSTCNSSSDISGLELSAKLNNNNSRQKSMNKTAVNHHLLQK